MGKINNQLVDVTDVRDQEHFHRVKYSNSTVKEIQNNVNCEVYKRIV